MAVAGDGAMIRLLVERILPVRRERPIPFRLPKVNSAADAPVAVAAVLEAVGAGEITLSEAAELNKLIDSLVWALQANEVMQRLEKIEVWQDRFDKYKP